MKIYIESDKDISELSIKFSEGMSVTTTPTTKPLQKASSFSKAIEETVDMQEDVKPTKEKKEKINKQPPQPLDIPDTQNRDVNIDPGMSETF